MSVNINRMYKAMNKVDPQGKFRWYVTGDCGVQLEAHGFIEGVSFQASGEIHGDSSNYSKYFQPIFAKMELISKSLEGYNEERR